jgi:tetratricopeptide (TPR) repeat protein
MRGWLAGIVVTLALGPLAMNVPAFAQAAPIGKSAISTAAPLLDQLKTAKDEATARMLEAQVWAAWSGSGDDRIDELMQRASALMQTQDFDEALAVLDGVVAKAPEFAEGWNKRATLLYMMNDYDGSLADIAKVLALEPRHFGALSGIALIRTAKGDRAGALAAYKRVLEVDPMNLGAKLSLDALGQGPQGDPI